MAKTFVLGVLALLLMACHSTYSPAVVSELQQSKRDFDGGYYKRTMRELLPLACDGNPDAEYAIGYMYYYGYGVAQDTNVGAFWIERSAQQHYCPAVKAMDVISGTSN